MGLEVRDGGSASAPLLALLCGQRIPESVFASGNRLFLRQRPGAPSGFGFEATFASSSSSSGVGCGGAVFNTLGAVTSGRRAAGAADCRWQLSVPLGMRIQIEFTGNYLVFTEFRLRELVDGVTEFWNFCARCN